jgi:hypothetical protein
LVPSFTVKHGLKEFESKLLRRVLAGEREKVIE